MLKIDSIHSMDEYMDLLSSSLTIYMDAARLNKASDDVAYKADDLKALALMWLRIESAGSYAFLSSDDIVSFLGDIGVDLEKRYANKKTRGVSLDIKRVIDPLIKDGVASEFLTTYKEHRSYKSYAATLNKLADHQVYHCTGTSGRDIVKYPTHVGEKDNCRVYYRDINPIGIPKDFSYVVTGPSDEYYIAWCDYPQADWRFAYNLFVRSDEADKIMRECSDAYEGLARIIEGEQFDPVQFKEKRREYKVHCLKVFYGSKDKSPIPTALREYYCKQPRYARLLYDLSVLYRFKIPIPCRSYFGYEQLIPEGAWEDAFVNKALNTPVQTFTSHVVNETVFGLLNKFWSLGYTKDDINIYYVRHDEPLFLFTKKIMKDAWIFKECSEIYIPGFTPIHLDFHFGRNYTEEDPQLTEEIQRSIDASDHVYEIFEGGGINDYSPMPSVESIYAQFFAVDGGLRVKLYDYRDGRRWEITAYTEEPGDALMAALENGGLKWLGNPEYLYVRTIGLEMDEYIEGDTTTYVKVVDRYDSSVAAEG